MHIFLHRILINFEVRMQTDRLSVTITNNFRGGCLSDI